jgi:PAS domain S-box-containing protein
MRSLLEVLHQFSRASGTREDLQTLERQSLLHEVLSFSLKILPVAWLLSIPVSPTPISTTLFYLMLFLFVGGLRWANQTGRTSWAAGLFVSLLTLALVGITWVDGGLQSPSFPIFVVLMAFAVLMFSPTVAVLFCSGVIVYGMLLLWAVQSGLLSVALYRFSRINILISYVFQWLALIGLVGLFLREQRRAFALLQSKSDELQQTRLKAEQTQHLFQSMPESVVVIGEDDTIQFANNITLTMLGRTAGELQGRLWREILLSPECRHWSFAPLSQGGRGQIQRELEYLHRDGSTIPVLFSMLRQEESGQWVCYARNLLQRKQVEEELEEARKQAEQASQNKSNFLARMSHELRTPLNVVIGYSDMQREMLQGERPELVEELTKILQASEQLLSLVNDTLDLSSIEAGRPYLMLDNYLLPGLLEPVRKACESMKDQKNNEFLFSNNSAVMWLHGDPAKTRQILQNLLSNAFQNTEEGVVSLVVYDKQREGQDGVCFSVTDNGEGLSREELNNVFHQFVQAELSDLQALGGTGVGLSLSRRFAQKMGGELEVESQSGSGSTFRLWLPLKVELESPLDEAAPAT